MRTLKGIVFEKKSNYMIFLTKNGEFIKGIPIENEVEIGDDVYFQIITPTATMKSKRLKIYSPILAAAVIFILIFTALFQSNNHVYAYVQLEMEQSLEFGLDKNGLVITSRLLDEDLLLSKDELAKWKGESISNVLNEVIEELSTMKQVEDTPHIQITAVYEPVEEIEVKELIENTVQEIRNTHAEILWDVSESSMDIRKRANQNKMTIRQYNQTTEQKEPKEIKDKKDKNKPTNENKNDPKPLNKQNNKDELPKGKSENNRNDSSGNNGKSNQQKDNGQKEKKEKVQESNKNSSQPHKQQNSNDSKKTGPNGKPHPHKDEHPGKGKGPEKSKSNDGN